MKNMKKWSLLLMSMLVIVLLAACSDKEEKPKTDEKGDADSNQSEKTEKVTIDFWHAMSGAGQDSLEKIVKSFSKIRRICFS